MDDFERFNILVEEVPADVVEKAREELEVKSGHVNEIAGIS